MRSGSAVTLAKLVASSKAPDSLKEGELVNSVYQLVLSSADTLSTSESGASEVASRAVEALRCVHSATPLPVSCGLSV